MGITVGKSYDRSAAEFFNVTQVLTALQKQAVNTLVTDLKIYNLWDKMVAIYPLVGQPGVSSSFQYNLKDPRNSNDAYRLSFTVNWTFASTGVTPNGTSDYANTFLNSNTLEFTSNHLSIYGGTSDVTRFHYNMGAKDDFFLEIASYGLGRNLNTQTFKSGLTDNSGFFLASRSASTTTKLFQNNIILNTVTTSTENTRDSLVIFGARSDGSPASIGPINYADGEVRFVSIGDGLTDTEAANFYTAVQRFQTTLGRQV